MRIEKVKISKLKLNSSNPRFIRDEQFERLKKSLIDFPEMKELREIIVDEDYTILGGNMRFRAMKENGEKEIIVKVAEGLTDAQKREFVIKDNSTFGDWDTDALCNEFEKEELIEFGVPNYSVGMYGNNEDIKRETRMQKEFKRYSDSEQEAFVKFPIIIILNEDEFIKWEQLKKDTKEESDNAAFKKIVELKKK